MKKRKTYDDQFKARVAMEAVKGEKTISEIAAQFEVHPNQIMKWKRQLLEIAGGVFSRKQEPEVEEMKELIDKLYKKIGEQDIELEFLKKSTSSSRVCKEGYGGEGERGFEYSEAV
ncbi:MAG: transposase [Candidatus Aminicenantes bacterium]|nr:transposase [Candidatus Aminicenantes bacterium]